MEKLCSTQKVYLTNVPSQYAKNVLGEKIEPLLTLTFALSLHAHCFQPTSGIFRKLKQKKWISSVFSAFYGRCSVMEAWTNLVPGEFSIATPQEKSNANSPDPDWGRLYYQENPLPHYTGACNILNEYSRDCGWPRRTWPNVGLKKKKKRPKITFFP